jgi:type IV secretion system protein VirD4
MGAPRPQATLGDELANLGVALLIGAAVLAVLMRGAGTVAAW